MADSILRLKVESQEYDSKIKRAAEGIQDLAKRIHDSQGEFAGLESSQKEFIKDLQYMTTVSKTTTGQARELETAYKQLQALYNSFNGFEKNSEEGKLLAEQLAILKQRTLDAKAAISDASKSLEDHGSILDTLTSKFTVNIDALKLFDMGLKAVKSALDVAKDAFFASEANVDEWGRTMQASQALYEGFLTALNNSDVSGFLSNMDDIVTAARAAYNEIDRLGTMQTIQSPQKSAQQTEISRMRMMIQTGRYIAPLDGRSNAVWNGQTMKNGQLLTPEQIRNIERHLRNGMQTMVSLVGNEVKQTGKAIDAYYNSLARQNGMTLVEFRKGTSSMAEFDKRIAGYEKYKKFEAEHTTLGQRYNPQMGEYETYSVRDNVRNPYQQYRNWGTFRVDKQGENSYNDLINYIRQRDQLQSEVYGIQAQGYRVINRAEGITVRGLMGGNSGGSNTSPSEQAQNKFEQAQQDYRQALEQAALEVKAGTADAVAAKKKELSAAESLWKAIGDAREIYDGKGFKEAQENAAKKVIELGGNVTALVDAQKKAQEAARELAQAQKKVADALSDVATAYNANDLKGYLSALGKVGGDVAPGLGSGNFSLTKGNMAAFGNYLGEKISTTNYGSVQYKNLSAQQVDVTTLSTLISEAAKRGIDLAEFDPQGLWKKIFGENPGDYITDEEWKSIFAKVNEQAGKNPIKINFTTGQLEGSSSSGSNGKNDFNKLVGNVSTITGALNQLGVEIPEGFSKTLGVLQVISTITMAIQSLVGLTASTSILKSIPIIGWFLHNGGVVHAANGFNGIVPGTQFSGDNIPAMLNAGETVLSASQANMLASVLNDAGRGGTGRTEAVVESDQIRLVLQNGAQAKGMTLGEYLNI